MTKGPFPGHRGRLGRGPSPRADTGWPPARTILVAASGFLSLLSALFVSRDFDFVSQLSWIGLIACKKKAGAHGGPDTTRKGQDETAGKESCLGVPAEHKQEKEHVDGRHPAPCLEERELPHRKRSGPIEGFDGAPCIQGQLRQESLWCIRESGGSHEGVPRGKVRCLDLTCVDCVDDLLLRVEERLHTPFHGKMLPSTMSGASTISQPRTL